MDVEEGRDLKVARKEERNSGRGYEGIEAKEWMDNWREVKQDRYSGREEEIQRKEERKNGIEVRVMKGLM